MQQVPFAFQDAIHFICVTPLTLPCMYQHPPTSEELVFAAEVGSHILTDFPDFILFGGGDCERVPSRVNTLLFALVGHLRDLR